MGRPREHGPDTRARLLDAAGQLLGAHGAAAVTVRGVADEAGTSTRAVYTLFGGKEGLLRALFHEAAEVMRRHHEDVPVQVDPIAEVRLLAQAYRSAALEQPNLYDLYLGMGQPGVQPTQEDLDLAFRSFERVLEALRRAQAAGRLGGRDPEPVGRQAWAMVHGLASLELRGYLGDPSAAGERWRDAVDAMLLGYSQPPAGPPGVGASEG